MLPRGSKMKRRKELSVLFVTYLLDLIYNSTKHLSLKPLWWDIIRKGNKAYKVSLSLLHLTHLLHLI